MALALTLNDTNDTELMSAYCQGDAQAFSQLYARHKTDLYRYVLNNCSNESTAAELFQDVWTKVINKRESYKKDSPFNAWVYRIARNTVIDYYRREAKHYNDDSFDENSLPTAVEHIQTVLQPDEMSILSQQSETLQQALLKLPVKQRDAILMRHVAGMTLTEMANSTHENNETIKSRLRYATNKLRQILREAL